MNEIRRGRERIHGAHKDDPQYREWLKLYISGDKIGPFERTDHAVLLLAAGIVAETDGILGYAYSNRLKELARILSSLWMEGEYVSLPSTCGNYASLPDDAKAFELKDDIDIVADVDVPYAFRAPGPTVHHDETHGYHTADGDEVLGRYYERVGPAFVEEPVAGASDVLERLKEFEVYHYLRGPKQERLIYDAIAEIERLMETNRLISLDIHKAWEALEQIACNDTARRPGDREDLIETAAEALEGK